MITGLLNQTISIASKSGRNRYGRETPGTATDVNARVELGDKNILLPNGTTIVVKGRVFVAGDTSVEAEDKVTFNGVDYRVISKNVVVDGSGATRHLELQLGEWTYG